MMPVLLGTPEEQSRAIAQRAKARRVALGLTQEELAMRSGVALATLRLFERSGQISLKRLLQIANVLGVLHSFQEVLPAPVPVTLAELTKLQKNAGRKYGRKTTSRGLSR